MGLVKKDDGWRIPDELWEQMEPLLPPRPKHPLGCHNPRVPDRAAMNAILLVLRTGMHWNALSATGVCSSSSAYRRFREWCDAGVFLEFWQQGLLAYDALKGIDWNWLACGRGDDEGAAGWGEKPAPILRIAAKAASSAARSLTRRACHWPLRWPGPIVMT
jgi:transposase